MIKKVDNNQFYTGSYSDNRNRARKVNEETPAFLLDYDENGVIWEREGSRSKDPEGRKKSAERDSYEASSKNGAGHSGKKAEKKAEKNPGNTSEEGIVAKAVAAVKNLFRRFMNVIWYGDDEDAVKKNNREAASQELSGLFDLPKESASAEDITEEMSAYIDDETSEYPEPLEDEEEGKEIEEEDDFLDEDPEEELAAYSDEEIERKRYTISNHNGKIMIHVGAPDKDLKGAYKNNSAQTRTAQKEKEASRDALLTYYDKTGRLVKLDGVNTGRILRRSRDIN
ncbi:MAG: hypothetical protein BWY61_00578 [Firmicutes bacterium ADurb.Bin354]|nr:MAG: hypothetical protein BWY61_00578 [Firmicutes bacterium ADurb.Bin354]